MSWAVWQLTTMVAIALESDRPKGRTYSFQAFTHCGEREEVYREEDLDNLSFVLVIKQPSVVINLIIKTSLSSHY